MDSFLTSVYWGAALFFSVMFAWQMLATLFGHFGGGDSIDAGGAHDVGAGGHDVGAGHDAAVDSVASFKLLSIRSMTAFGLLFGWAGVLYSRAGWSQNATILISVGWGVVGMLIVSSLFYFFMRMTESGTRRLSTAIGQPATVYMDIPANGAGQVRVLCGGTICFVSARAVGGEALKAGTPVVIRRVAGPNVVEVEKAPA